MKIKFPINGYAPGTYMCACGKCKSQFLGDKLSVRCLLCALSPILENTINRLRSLDMYLDVSDPPLKLYDVGQLVTNILDPLYEIVEITEIENGHTKNKESTGGV